MGVTCIKTVKKPSYLQQSIPDAEKRAAKTQGVGDSGSIKKMQEELEWLRNEMAKKNRNQLDMMYNLDFDNFSEDTQALFKKWSDGTTEAMAYFKAYADANESKWEAYAQWKDDTTDSIASITGRVSANESSISSLASWKSNTADAAISSIAGIQQTANANKASIDQITEWKSNTADAAISSITEIRQTSNANKASIDQITKWKTETADGAIESIAGIRQTANANKASIDQITAWKTETADGAIESISSIQQQADANGARISLLVNSGGTGLTQSAAGIIVDAVNGSGSSVMIKADKIQFDGEASFVTAGSLGDSGSTVVSGNRIKLHMLYETSTATSKLNFTASDTASDTWYDTLATIGLKNYGSNSADDAKYALLIDSQFANENGKEYNVALKLSAKGSISIESATPDGGIYIAANGFTTIEAYENVRIRASASMANMGQTGLMAFSNKDYVFCTDGIYYNGKRIVDNTQEV